MNDRSLQRSIAPALPVLVALQLAGILTYDYADRVAQPAVDRQVQLHSRIIEGDAPYQYRYRVLVPVAAEYAARGVEWAAGPDATGRRLAAGYGVRAFGLAYASLQFLFLAVFFYSLYLLLATWYTAGWSYFGMAMAAVVTSFTFRDHYFHPWSFCEMALYASGLLLLHRGRYLEFTGVNILGVLNRETSLFLLFAFLLIVVPSRTTPIREYLARTDVRFAATNAIVWLAGFLMLHAAIGYLPATFTIERAVEGNLARWPYALLLNALVLGPLWFLLLRGWQRAPPFISRVAWILVPYVGLLLVIGFWWEIRYWIPMLPILISLLVASLQPASGATSGQTRGPLKALRGPDEAGALQTDIAMSPR